jgi:DNA-binding MarR family transcriptional regulator
MRLAFRMIDDEARRAGIDPLAHQLLVQLRGSSEGTRSVSELATRLDVSLALTSRLAAQLEQRELVVRTQSSSDRRVTLICITASGDSLVRTIAAAVRTRFKELQNDFSYELRHAAVTVWADNFAVDVTS